jgi:sec-independent protein translocase protein TatB
MFDVGWMELLIIGVVALVVIGPKDLPDMFRTLGRFTAKLRSMAREFQRAMDDAAKESGVKEAMRDVNTLTTPKSAGLEAVKSAADKFEKWDPLKSATKATKPLTPPPMPATPTAAAAPAAAAAEAAPVAAAVGPNTAALYDQKAARKAILDEAAAKLRAIGEPATALAVAPEAAVKKPGRRRKAADQAGIEGA